MISNQKCGFSLVELSIVLVLLGLLTGGVLTGKNLIRAAEIRGVQQEIAHYETAINIFNEKYFAYPGDMNNATSFWGAAHATPATCITTASTGTQTCNGNGDGYMGLYTGTTQYEGFSVNWYTTSLSKHFIQLGGQDTMYNAYEPFMPVLTPAELYGIDKKYDDSKPATGKIITQKPSIMNCATTNSETTALYNLSSDAIGCSLIYILD
jgi:prepilin-type N-terminal cleavage/methylation domain-containing protein